MALFLRCRICLPHLSLLMLLYSEGLHRTMNPRDPAEPASSLFTELCVKLSLLRLFHVDHIVQNRRSALSLTWHEWFSCKGREWKIYCCELAFSSEPQIWKFHVVVWQTTSKHCTKKRAARLFFLIQPIKSLICDVVVDAALVKTETSKSQCQAAVTRWNF